MIIYLLVFFSGLSSLVYQVLWMKQLGLLFGNTSHAASATLAAFFLGLAVGSAFWGKRAAKARNALRSYAWLEAGIAVTALLYFVILALYARIYPAVFQRVDSAEWLLLIKFALALLLVFPPAFCMGGTIPLMGQYVVRRRSSFGRTSALLYGINTLGAALGAGLGGFFLPLWLGFRMTCIGAMLLTAGVGVAAYWLSGRAQPAAEPYVPPTPHAREDVAPDRPTRERWVLLAMSFLSGFGILALEILWTRMFAQVLENSVYTFSAILVTVLISLSLGSLISSRLARLELPALPILAGLTVLSGAAVAVTPQIFMHLTDGMQIIAVRSTWSEYVSVIFRNTIFSIGVPAVLLGTLFPFLMKVEERHSVCAGRSLGTLAAINTAGAILGSLICGFVFLEHLGMWATMQVLAVIYLLAALALPIGPGTARVAVRIASLLMLALLFTGLNPRQLPLTSVDTMRQSETVLEVWEGSDATVAVTQGPHGLSIKINSHYGLGSTGAYMQEKLQADLPLMIAPTTESVFFLGMGTGITAGGALDDRFPSVKRVLVCELAPDVIEAAQSYMTDVRGFDFTTGLFSDPRARVLAEDGRHYLMATDEQYDLINADLFVPYRSGAGSLYTKEHFERAMARLEPGGLFVQWLPLYQVTENEFSIIARTMLEVFPQVSLWRGNFQIGEEVVALVGHPDGAPLPASDVDNRADKAFAIAGKTHRDLQRLALPLDPQTILFFYGGNLTEARSLFAAYPINTDDRPLIEYMAPRSYRDLSDTPTPWFVGPRIIQMIEAVQEACPAARDPLLANRTVSNRRLPSAGSAFHRARLWEVIGDENETRNAWYRFLREWRDQPR